MPLYIPASIIVIAFYMVFQSILFIACKKYKTLLLVLLHAPLVRHILLLFSSFYIGYLLNTVNFKLCCITHRTLSLREHYYLNSLLIPRLNPHSLRSFSFNPLMFTFFNKCEMVSALLLMLHHSFGIIYQTPFCTFLLIF